MVGERTWAYVFSIATTLAVVWPAFLSPRDDNFPLSTYPMFSHGRRSPDAKVAHAVAVAPRGRRRVPPPALVASEEIMQTFVSTQRAVRSGRAPELCRRVAARLASAGEEWSAFEEVQVRTDWYDAVRYFSDSPRPNRSKVHARCPIPRD